MLEQDEEVEDYTDSMPDPPFTVRSREHLIELLSQAGKSGPGIEAMPEFWAQKEAELLTKYYERVNNT